MTGGWELGLPTLLERDAELDALRSALAGLGRRRAGVVSVEAPPGLGKTSLLREAVAAAQAMGHLTLRARGHLLEQGLAWGVVRQLLGPVAQADTAAELLEGPAGLARRALGLADGGAETDLSGGLYGLYWVVRRLAETTPLVLVVDDAHWADDPSLAFLTYLANRLETLPLLLVVAMRAVEPQARSPHLEMLTAGPEANTLHPASLSAPACSAVARERLTRLSGERLERALYETTGGNPFLLVELCRDLEAHNFLDEAAALDRLTRISPSLLGPTVLARLGSHPPLAREIARAVAVLGTTATLNRIERLTGASTEEVADIVSELTVAEVLRYRAHTVDFVHPVVRQAAYEEVAPSRRAQLHGATAEILAEDGADVGLVAEQLLKAAPAARLWRVTALRRAAGDARASGAPAAASVYLQRALDEPAPRDLHYVLTAELGDTLLHHDPAAAVVALKEALHLADSPAARLQAAQALARALALRSDFAGALAVLGDATANVAPDDERAARAIDSARLAYARWDLGSQPLRRELFLRLRERAALQEPLDAPEQANLAHELTALGEDRATVVACARAVIDSASAAPLSEAGWALQLSSVLVLCDHVEEAEELTLRFVAAAQERGSAVNAATALTLASHCALWRGDVRVATQRARAALESQGGIWSMGAIAWLIEALAEQGEHVQVEQILAEHGLGDGPQTDDGRSAGYQVAALLIHRAHARAVAGRHEMALDDLDVVRKPPPRGRCAIQPSSTGARAWRAHCS